MSFDLQIREQISRYCGGEIDAADLETWLAATTWEIDQEPPATRQLAADALRLTSEAANGDWTDEELRGQLKALGAMVTDSGHSVSGDISPLKAEGFLEKLAAAEEAKAQAPTEDQHAAVMRYAHVGSPTAGSSGSEQPSGRGFLRRSTGERETPSQHPREPAIG